MFSKVLIANRGEIACRVMRTAHRLGIRSVAVYSDADRGALHVSLAGEAVHIGAAPARESYLSVDRVIAAARRTGAEAIHPGYGFLSESAELAAACADNDIVFIGPPVAAIKAMGSKSAAKAIMERAGVPLLPGFHGDDQTEDGLRAAAAEIGFPVLLKASAGGGGKGMRIVTAAGEFDDALASAKREAMSSFGDDQMLVEKFLSGPRHVEIQVFSDRSGNTVHLFERDCSVQRRHQKVVEEAPAPNLSAELRTAMGESARQVARAIDYEGAGTVEFLLDRDSSYYFMEMNTRLQVEHPVTEMITRQDLVEWQLRVAAGEALPLRQDELKMDGHSFEARIYAEDPANNFLPAPGKLSFLRPPANTRHTRVDTGVVEGDCVSSYYDPMIAKLVVWDENRDKALARMATALTEYRVSGTTTNIEFLYNLVTSAPFMDARIDTHFIEDHRQLLFRDAPLDVTNDLHLASLYLLLRRESLARELASARDPHSPWNATNAWRLNEANLHTGSIILDGSAYDVPAEQIGFGGSKRFRITACGVAVSATGTLRGDELIADIDGYRTAVSVVEHDNSFTLFSERGASRFALPIPDYGDVSDEVAPGSLAAPMNGTVVAIMVEPGQSVERGQKLVMLEAMKMEHAILAPRDGVVAEVNYKVGDLVDGGADLLALTD